MTIPALEVHKNRRVQYLATLAVSLASFTVGISSAWPTIALPKLKMNETNIQINSAEIALMLGMSPVGHATGSLAFWFVVNRIGRRATVLISAFPFAIGTVVVIVAQKAWQLYVTKFLWGFGIGMLGLFVEMYIGEISDPEVRGTLIQCTAIMLQLGSLLVLSTGMFITYESLNYMLLVLPVLYFFACLRIPETPYYLLKRGRVGEAREALMKLRNNDEKELDDKLASMHRGVRNEMRPADMFKTLRRCKKALIIGVVLKIVHILTGTVVAQQYLSVILEESKIHLELSTACIVFGVVKFIVCIMCSILVDRVGRRPLLIYSFLLTSISLTAISTYFYLKDFSKVPQASLDPYAFVPFAGIISTTALSTLGYSSVIYILLGEIFPLNIKAAVLSILHIVGGACGLFVSQMFQWVQDRAGFFGVFLFFASVSLVGAIFGFFCVPEPKRKDLGTIQVLLQGDLYEGEKLNNAKDNVNDRDNDNELQELNLKDENCKS